MRAETLARHPALREALAKLGGTISATDMRRMVPLGRVAYARDLDQISSLNCPVAAVSSLLGRTPASRVLLGADQHH